MTRIDQLKDPRYLRHPRLKDRPLGVLTHPQPQKEFLIHPQCPAVI